MEQTTARHLNHFARVFALSCNITLRLWLFLHWLSFPPAPLFCHI
jgi:hypothetical protein